MNPDSEEIARRIAQEASELACERLAAKLEISSLVQAAKLKEDIKDIIDQRFIEYFGMTPQEHLIEHSQMRNHLSFIRGVWVGIGKKLAMGLLIAAIAFSGVATKDLFNKTLPPRDEPRKEKRDATNP